MNLKHSFGKKIAIKLDNIEQTRGCNQLNSHTFGSISCTLIQFPNLLFQGNVNF